MFRRIRPIIAAAALVLTAAAGAQAEEPYPIAWVRQLGTAGADSSMGVAVDASGNVFMSGWTAGSLGGPNAGAYDAFVSKHDPDGNLVWTRQLGTRDGDQSDGVAVDASGNVFISGYTRGSLDGPSFGQYDAFVARYDPQGALLWKRQLGSDGWDMSYGVAVDPLSNVFISGYTDGSLSGPNAGNDDAFVSKYDPDGALLWVRQLGTRSFEFSKDVATDQFGNVFISGATSGNLAAPNPSPGSADVFVAKYDPAGSLLWARQIGTAGNDETRAVATDHAGNILITGDTYGSLGGPNAGKADVFVGKYDPQGTLLWLRQLGTSYSDVSFAVAADASDNVFISGQTNGSLGGPNAGDSDIFVCKFDPDGALLWTRQLGTTDGEGTRGVATGPAGSVFISGYAYEDLGGGPNRGEGDAFVVKLVPEPATLALLGLGAIGLIRRRRARKRGLGGLPHAQAPLTLKLTRSRSGSLQ